MSLKPPPSLARHIFVLALLLVACRAAPGPASPTAPPPTAAAAAGGTSAHPAATEPASTAPPAVATATSTSDNAGFFLPQARSLQMTAGPGETVYVLAGHDTSLRLYRSDDGGQTFAAGALVSQGDHAEVLAVVRPGLAAGVEGRVGAAWVAMAGAGQSVVRAAFSDDGGTSFAEPVTLATTSDPETTMATLAFDDAGRPLVTWLQNSSVRFAVIGTGGDAPAPAVVDDLVCECCQPALLLVGERIFLAYRNLVRDATGVASRDIHLAASSDGGATFAAPVPVSDGAWHIDACPIAGPALAAREGTLYVVWMDGRFDDGTFARTDVWLAVSRDGGATFGPNVRVNLDEGSYHGQPALALDTTGRLHVAWPADTPTGQALLYAVSDDGGATFGAQQTVVEAGRRLGSVAITVTGAGRVILGWNDATGAHARPLE